MVPSTQRFSRRVDYYVRSRPKYPAALLRFFQTDLSLSSAHVVADIGAGTGLLTELLVRNGNPTFAVEPNEPMRAAADAALGDSANYHSVSATAEATTLADHSVDFITAGQAFHWFDVPLAASEFRRILKPRGLVALIWNETIKDGSPFMVDYERLIAMYRREQIPMDDGIEDIAKFFGSGGYKRAHFENPQVLDCQGVMDRLTSSSYMPLPDDDGYVPMLCQARKIFDQHQQNQTISILHQTEMFYGPLSD